MGQSRPYGDRSILIVESEHLIRMDLADFFGSNGFRVLQASDAEEAVEVLLHDAGVRVVLADVHLPGSIDGLRLAHLIRDRYPPTILFVMSSARAIPNEDLPVRTVFLRKPFNTPRLLRLIEVGAPG